MKISVPIIFTGRAFFLIGMILLSLVIHAQPVNNNCATATVLTSSTSCVNTAGTVQAATNSGVPVAPCTGTPDDDVWYSFVTASTDHTITLSNIGANLLASGPRLQLFSGTCVGLTSVACGTTSIAMTTLARNTTYYIRVYSAGATAIASNAGFNICVTHPAPPAPLIDLGKSFINTSKPTGGTIETNDILEIRASVVVRANAFDSCRFMDVIPAGTVYIPGTLRILTNEGKIYKQFTDAQFDVANDEGWITGSNITMNLGYRSVDQPATVYRRGRIRNNNGHKPSFYNSSCILVASYRVRVTSAIGTTINTGGGNVTYTTAPPVITTFTFPAAPVAVFTNYGICSNTVGVNSLGTETNGTFGSGNLKNRGTSASVPAGYTYSPFTNGMPNDYYYGIANNTCTQNWTTLNTWLKPDPDPDGAGPLVTHRVFSLWDIIGDHTGAVSPTAGNPAADTTGGKTGGYMLIINAAYRIDSAFDHTISGLCANTYYEISCWMRNICSKCGCDTNGTGASGGGYIPSGPGDSSGVRPNLAFALNGVRYYTSGDLPYNGQWVKKGFTFLTGPAQTSFTLRFYNNAPGGGGNDWALDDISVVTCSPNMSYGPTINPIVCDSNAIQLSDTVRSFFNNYTYYKWQRSTNGGASWFDITPALGPSSPFWNGSAWEYVTLYTIPPSMTLLSNNGDLYRVLTATTSANLGLANCQFTNTGSIIGLHVIDCGDPLATQLLSFTGQLNNEHAVLNWTTSGEDEPFYFDIEKSYNGRDYLTIATVNSHNDYAAERNIYSFTDPSVINGKTYYRIKMKNNAGQSTYSRSLQLSLYAAGISFVNVINPFSNRLLFDVSSGQSTKVTADVIDPLGKIIRRKVFELTAGINSMTMEDTQILPPGIYILRVQTGTQVIQKIVMKQ